MSDTPSIIDKNKDAIIFTDAMNSDAPASHSSCGISGPGSQPGESDGAELDILQLPSGMTTFEAPILPEPEDVSHLGDAVRCLEDLLEKMGKWAPGSANIEVSVQTLDPANRELVDQVMGEGEVSILFGGDGHIRIQESVLCGVWRIQNFNSAGEMTSDNIEVGPIPSLVQHRTFATAAERVNEDTGSGLPDGVINAPPLLAEINEVLEDFDPQMPTHTINLTLLPQTEQDLMFLDSRLGLGNTTILSRGYGNCRITSTGTKNVWWVRYFNSQDKNILNSIEICLTPEAACAAAEDIEDSTVRLAEILEIYQ
ncbi:MAG: hydrogenase expression/formation C-terminal domain-containing protein [Thalassolituus sp.]